MNETGRTDEESDGEDSEECPDMYDAYIKEIYEQLL